MSLNDWFEAFDKAFNAALKIHASAASRRLLMHS
jgi:hypothetical protein